MSWRLNLNMKICHHKHSWKCPQVSSKLPRDDATNKVGNVPIALQIYMTSLPQTQLEKCPDVCSWRHEHVPLKTLSLVAMNKDISVPRPCYKHSPFVAHKKGKNCWDFSSKISHLVTQNLNSGLWLGSSLSEPRLYIKNKLRLQKLIYKDKLASQNSPW